MSYEGYTMWYVGFESDYWHFIIFRLHTSTQDTLHPYYSSKTIRTHLCVFLVHTRVIMSHTNTSQPTQYYHGRYRSKRTRCRYQRFNQMNNCVVNPKKIDEVNATSLCINILSRDKYKDAKFPELSDDNIKQIKEKVKDVVKQKKLYELNTASVNPPSPPPPPPVPAEASPIYSTMPAPLGDPYYIHQIHLDRSFTQFTDQFMNFVHYFNEMNTSSIHISFRYVVFRCAGRYDFSSISEFLRDINHILLLQKKAHLTAEVIYNTMVDCIINMCSQINSLPMNYRDTNNIKYESSLHNINSIDLWISQWSERFYCMNTDINNIMELYESYKDAMIRSARFPLPVVSTNDIYWPQVSTQLQVTSEPPPGYFTVESNGPQVVHIESVTTEKVDVPLDAQTFVDASVKTAEHTQTLTNPKSPYPANCVD